MKLRADFVYENGVVEISLLHVCTGESSIFRLSRVTEKPLAHSTAH